MFKFEKNGRMYFTQGNAREMLKMFEFECSGRIYFISEISNNNLGGNESNLGSRQSRGYMFLKINTDLQIFVVQYFFPNGSMKIKCFDTPKKLKVECDYKVILFEQDKNV